MGDIYDHRGLPLFHLPDATVSFCLRGKYVRVQVARKFFRYAIYSMGINLTVKRTNRDLEGKNWPRFVTV